MTEAEFTALPYVTATDDGIIVNGWSVDLPSLTTLPEGVQFRNSGYVDLPSLTTLPEGVQFLNGGSAYLPSLTTLPEGVQFRNDGHVYLTSLTTLPADVQFHNVGGMYLPSLTTLPEGVQFRNDGHVDLPSLTATQRYQGHIVTFRNIDEYMMLLTSRRELNGIEVHTARYLKGGDYETLPQCYVAIDGEFTAHGRSVREAIEDVRFKRTSEELDVDDIVSAIRERGTVTAMDYRLLTGACREGLRHGLSEAGLDPETEELPLPDVLRLSDGRFGGERIRELLGTE